MLRYYRVDLLDFYRDKLSARRLGVLVRQLPAESALSRAMNDNQPPWSASDHLLADLWVVMLKILNPKSRITDHPRRAEMEAKARTAAKLARVIDLRNTFKQRKKTYGLG